MDEKTIKLEQRLLAIESMVAQLYKMFFESIGATPRMIENKLKRFEKELQDGLLSGLDPAAAAEMQHAFEHLLEMIREMVGVAKKSKE